MDTKFTHAENEASDPHVQADFSLLWAHLSEGTFSLVLVRRV